MTKAGNSTRRPGADGLYTREREVMDLWDAGIDVERIAAELGMDLKAVRQIVSRLNVRGESAFDAMVRQGSEALLAAIRRHHPEQLAGGAA